MNGLQFVFYESIGLHTKTNEMMIQCIISNITAAVPRLLMIILIEVTNVSILIEDTSNFYGGVTTLS